jgi:hypothetical protein
MLTEGLEILDFCHCRVLCLGPSLVMRWVSASTGITSLVKCKLSLAGMWIHTWHLSQVGFWDFTAAF